MRGGTSKAVFLMAQDIPADRESRRRIILRIFGSPDKRQIDGLGGADPLTSKCAVIERSPRTDADITLAFYQVGIESDVVKPSICGNIAAAVGLFAVEQGLVTLQAPITTVVIHDIHTDRLIYAGVPTDASGALTGGKFAIAGVPGTGPRIMLDWHTVVGIETGALLPTGHARDFIDVPGVGSVEVSIVDCGNPVVFIEAQAMGLSGTELPDAVNNNAALKQKAELIRGAAAERVGLVRNGMNSAAENPNHPFLALVAAPNSYATYAGEMIQADQVDIISRAFFMQSMHKTFPGSGALCLGVAAKLEGTVVAEAARRLPASRSPFRIGHPGGVMDVEVEVRNQGNDTVVLRAAFGRTARRILDGFVYVDVPISTDDTATH